jgi:lysophospholipase L1-like esterase
VIDLYSVTQAHPELRAGDGVHLTADGYSLLAKVLVERVKEVL